MSSMQEQSGREKERARDAPSPHTCALKLSKSTCSESRSLRYSARSASTSLVDAAVPDSWACESSRAAMRERCVAICARGREGKSAGRGRGGRRGGGRGERAHLGRAALELFDRGEQGGARGVVIVEEAEVAVAADGREAEEEPDQAAGACACLGSVSVLRLGRRDREEGQGTDPPRKAPTGFLTRATGAAAGGSGRGSGSRR